MQIDNATKKKIYLLEGAWIAMLTFACIFPLSFIILTVPIASLTAYFFAKNLRANAFILPFVLILLCIGSGGDPLVVLFSAITALGVVGAVWGLKSRSYLMGAAISALLLIAAAAILPIFYCLSSGKNTANFSGDYAYDAVMSDKIIFVPDSFISVWAEANYSTYNEKGYTKLDKTDEGYKEEVARVFSEQMWDWGANYIFYDLIGMASFAGILNFLIVFLSTKNSGRLTLKNLYEFKIHTEPIIFKNLRLNKRYILYVAIPAFALSFLGYIDSLENIAAAINNAFIAVPGAVAAFTLMYHTIDRTKSKPHIKSFLLSLWWFLAAVCMLSSLAVFIVSFLGIADAILNVRRLLDYALDEGEFEKKNK